MQPRLKLALLAGGAARAAAIGLALAAGLAPAVAAEPEPLSFPLRGSSVPEVGTTGALGSTSTFAKSREAPPTDAKREAERPRDDTPSGLRGSTIEITVGTPVVYTTAAVSASNDSVGARKGDTHFTPDLSAKWSKQFSDFKLTLAAGSNVDRFLNEREVDGNQVQASMKLYLTDGKSDLFVPYLAFTDTIYTDRSFRIRDTEHWETAVGATSGIGFDANGRIVSFQDATAEPGKSTVMLELRAGRRLSEHLSEQNRYVSGSVEYVYAVSKDLGFSIMPGIRVRWYDDYYGEVRRDIRAGATAKLIWTPEWLRTGFLKGSELTFEANYTRTYSTVKEARLRAWDFGPTVRFVRKFKL